MKRPFTADEVWLLAMMHLDRLSAAEMARRLDRHHHAIYRKLEDMKLPMAKDGLSFRGRREVRQ